MKPDPLGTPRHPLVVYLLLLCCLSGLTTLAGEPASGSVEAALSPAVTNTWGGVLLLGGVAALAGMFWQGDVRTGLVLKRWGYLALAIAASVYALVLAGSLDPGALLAGGIVLGFAVACALVVRRINQRIRAIVALSGTG